MEKGFLLSSGSQKQQKSFTAVLASALLEWLLIAMLFAYGFFGYLIAKFARFCELPIPCLLCSRIDHILGSEKAGFYLDMMCGKHKSELSSLVYCHFHEKLVDVRGMCESCLFSFATKDKSNAETYRLLVGKLGEEDLSGFDDDSLTNDHKAKSLNMKHCSCCNQLWTTRQHAQTLIQTKSTGFDDFDLDLPSSREYSQNFTHLKKEAKSFHSLADSGRINEDTSAQYEYTELKVTSDSESDIQMPDGEDATTLISNDPLRDLKLDYTLMEPISAVSEDENVTVKPIDLVILSSEPLEKSNVVPSDIINSPDCLSIPQGSVTIGHGLEELDWPEIDKMDLSELVGLSKIDGILESPNNRSISIDKSNNEEDEILPRNVDIKDSKDSDIEEYGYVEAFVHEADKPQELENVDIKDSKDSDIKEAEYVETLVHEADIPQQSENVDIKDSKDSDTKEAGVVETLVDEADKPQELESVKNATDLSGLKDGSEDKDVGLQIPYQLELGDAYKLAVSSRGKQFSGKLAEQRTGKESPRVSTDLKLLLSQFSRGSDLPSNDILSPSPRPSRNLDDLGIKLLQKRLSLERNDSKSSLDRNESGFESLDFSTISEIEGESELDRLKRQLEHDRKILISLLKELEEERNASATSTNEAMAMITRLQEEKAALQMEASHDLRMMEEQAEYDMEALDKLNALLTEKEKEIQDLEAELEYYRTNYPNESGLENVRQSSPKTCDTEKTRGLPDYSNTLADDLNSNSQEPLLELENERKHISERLNSLEKKLSFFCCVREYPDFIEGGQSEEQGKDSHDTKLPEVGVKSGTDENGATSEKIDMVSTRSHQTPVRCVDSLKRSKSAGAEQGALIPMESDITTLVNEVSNLSKRLRALEADQTLIVRSIDTLKNGKEELIQEIASHLRELRKIGIRRLE